MKEFVTAVAEVEAEDDREAQIKALMEREENPLSREDAEAEVSGETYIPFKVDGRELHAYMPTDGQLAFMLAALGRGQSADQRFAAIINIMLSSLRDEDADYLEGRLLDRNPKTRLPIEQVEAIFEYLTGEWFARPTQSPSGSAALPPSGGPN